jgi:hypothetical protein
VAFLDSDDAFLPGHLLARHRILEGRQDPDLCVYGRVVVERGEEGHFQRPARALGAGEHVAVYLMCDRGFIATSSLVVPAGLARRVRFDEDLRFGQDTDFAIRLQRAGARFAMVEQPTAIFSDRPDSDRLSIKRDPVSTADWLERQKGLLPDRAYRAYRGSHLAMGVKKAHFLRGALMSVSAIIYGSYSWRMSLIVLAQVLLSERFYRVASAVALKSRFLVKLAGLGMTLGS